MKNTELAELILKKLYDFAEENGHGRFASIDKIAEMFGEKDSFKVRNLVSSLKNRKLIHPMFTSMEMCGYITGDGALFVESGGETGVIREYESNPDHYHIKVDNSTHFHGDVSKSNVSVNSEARQQLTINSEDFSGLLDSIRGNLEKDDAMSPDEKADLIRDVDYLEKELKRTEPRVGVIRDLLSTFGSIASISSLAIKLGAMLGM